jgi:TonB family protein
MIRLFSLIVFLLVSAPAQELPPSGTTAPRVIQKSEPEYPDEARVAGLEGTVVVQAVIGEDGVPRDIRVAKSLGLGLDEKAVEAVSTWRFKPGMKDGVPVTDPMTIEVAFSAGLTPSWHLAGAQCDAPDGASSPTVIHRSFPSDSPKAEKDTSVAVSFDVDETGVPLNLHVEKSSDEKRDKDVIAALRQWKLKPALKDGKPVSTRCTWEFVRNEPSNQPKVVIR